MARRVVWTAAASFDLEEAAGYIARDSRYYAAAFVREIRAAAAGYRSRRVVPAPDASQLPPAQWVLLREPLGGRLMVGP